MKKIILSFAIVMLGMTAVSAQSQGYFYWGPKAGFTTDFQKEVKLTSESAKEVWDASQNYNAGIMFRANLPLSVFSLHLQPELMYHWQKGQYSKEDGTEFKVKEMAISSFDVPILLGVGLDLGLFNARVQAGPTIMFNSNATFEGGDNNKIDLKDVSYSWAAGVGIDLFSFIMIDFRYLGGWQDGQAPTKFTQLFEFDRINKDTKYWNLSIGLMF